MTPPRSCLPLALCWLAACSAPPSDNPGPPDDGLEEVDPAACLVDPGCDYLFGVGHRGTLRHAPENTVAAFQAAEAFGMDAVEMDVRPTSDEILVIMHDSSVDRTTDGSGDVSELSLEDIRALRIPSAFEGIDDQPVPTFSEALAALGPNTLVNVHAKTSRWDLIHADLEAAGFLDRAWVQTSDAAQTAEVVAAWPDLILMPDASTVAEVEELAPLAPATIEIPLEELDTPIFEACAAHGIKPSQNALGFADAGALGDLEQGGDGVRPYRAMAERGALLIQTDAPEALGPALAILNAERGWIQPR